MSAHWAALLPPPEPDADAVDPATLGLWALQFGPRVARLEDTVLMDVAASARLFGGLVALRRRVEGEARAMGARVAWAPTGLAALALARSAMDGDSHSAVGEDSREDLGNAVTGDGPRSASHGAAGDGFAAPLAEVLDALPLSAIAAVAEQQPTLARLGCRTLGDVRRLPRAGLARRVGPALLHALDQAYGEQPEAHVWLVAPERFEARLNLPASVDNAPALLFGAMRLLRQMAAWLAARHLGVLAFGLRWHRDSLRARVDMGDIARADDGLCIRTGRPSQSLDHLARLLAEHLARARLPAPVDTLVLTADEVAPMAGESLALIPDARQRGRSVDEALERIQARLGPGSVRRPVLRADHRLEWMQHWRPWQAGAEGRQPRGSGGDGGGTSALPVEGTGAGLALPVPNWLLPDPVPLAVQGERPRHAGTLHLLLGPDRVEGGWWHRVPGEPDARDGGVARGLNVQRDYWLAQSPQAGLLAVFQQRLAGDGTGWFLHGHFG